MESMMLMLVVGGMIALAIAYFFHLAVRRHRRRRGFDDANQGRHGTGNAMNQPNEPNDRQRPQAPELRDLDSGVPTWLKVVFWILGIVVGLPVVGLLLLFGYCAVAAR